MISFSDHGWRRLAVIGALVAALGLSACGRKGPLDPPPYAAAPAPVGAADNLRAAPAGTRVPGTPVDNPGTSRSPAPNQTFILDGLID